MRRAAKVDANHADIVKALREAGCSVISLAPLGAGIPDLCVATSLGRTMLMEVKNLDGKKHRNDEQMAFAASWQGEYAVVTSPEQAVSIVESK